MDESTNITIYTDPNQTLLLKYIDGVLVRVSVNSDDKVLIDGLKQYLELFEEDLKSEYFQLLK
ncbi:MAG: hypothetical protein N4A41_00480 [Crocinitomicaceae bacterium]|jgi:trehalose-6-phosphatase|nr:hypothetical protein [Crocinitomicaceae bacterium]